MVVAGRRPAAPPWRRVGARTRWSRPCRRTADRPRSAGPPGHRPAGRPRPGSDGVRGRAKSPRMTRCEVEHTPRVPGGLGRVPTGSAVVHMRHPPSTARRRNRRGGRRRSRVTGMDSTGRTARRGGMRRWPGAVLVAVLVGLVGVVSADSTGTAWGAPGVRAGPAGVRVRVAAARRGTRVRRRVRVAARAAGPERGPGVPRADAPLRTGPSRGRPRRDHRRARPRRRRGDRRVRRPAGRPRGGVAAARRRAADDLRARRPGRRGRHDGGPRSRPRHARRPDTRAARPGACTGGRAATGPPTSTRSCCSRRCASACSRCPTRGRTGPSPAPSPAPSAARWSRSPADGGPAAASRRAPHPAASSSSAPRSRPTSRAWSWQILDSVTPSIRPMSASVRRSR